MLQAIADSFDQSVVDKLNEWVHGSGGLVRATKDVTWFGNSLTLTVIVIVAAIALLVRRRHWQALYLATAASAGGLLNSTLKAIVGRARPVVEHPIATADGKSFPSGHAMSSTIIYGVLLIVFLPMVPKRWQPAAIAATVTLVLAIGASRVVLGVHYPSDVVAGHLIGMAVLLGATVLFSARRRVTTVGELPR